MAKKLLKYSKGTITQRDLTQMQEHFEHFQEKPEQLGTARNTPAHTEELAHLTEKFQK